MYFNRFQKTNLGFTFFVGSLVVASLRNELCFYTPKLAGLEEKDGDLTKVEVDEVLGLVGHVGAEVAADDGMPGGVVLFIELLLDEGSDVLLDVVLLKGLGRAIDGVLLHVLRHVGVFDHGLAVSHVLDLFID